MELYETLQIEVIAFEQDDVIVTSGGGGEGGEGADQGNSVHGGLPG